MKESELKLKLENALNNVENITGVDGTLVVNNQGEILYSSLSYADDDLFGSMANIISSSSEKLLELSKQGLTERVLVESVKGKALFLNMEKAHLVVLTNIKANIGMVILSSKKSAQLIKEMKEIKRIPDYFEEIEVESIPENIPEPATTKLAESDTTRGIIKTSPTSEIPQKEFIELGAENKNIKTSSDASLDVSSDYAKISDEIKIETEKVIKEENTLKENIYSEENLADSSDIQKEIISEDLEIESVTEKQEDLEPSKMDLPVIKPPLSFPKLPDSVHVSENPEEKAKLIIDIYEAVLLSMSIGASKIMGTAPARGMLKNSIPYEDCPELLAGVDVRSNSSIQFDRIRENIDKFPMETRSEKTINDFTTIISAITEKYGRVMGYDAFRGMIRPEFKKIYDSFGPAMEELGIKEKIHPELRELLVS